MQVSLQLLADVVGVDGGGMGEGQGGTEWLGV